MTGVTPFVHVLLTAELTLAEVVCGSCGGTRRRGGNNPWVYGGPCPACCCLVCGQPTDTPPECGDCFQRADDAARGRGQ